MDGTSAQTASHFVNSLKRAGHEADPFDHWILDDALPRSIIDRVASLPVAPPQHSVFDGTRESNNSTRLFFSPANQARFEVCGVLAGAFRDRAVLEALEKATGAPVSKGALRIEYCQDVDGFWLAPHLDISVKLFTLLIYLSPEPRLRDAGTDIYDAAPAHRHVATVPYEAGKGLIFIPGSDTWHGFSRRPIAGIRKSLIVNYVSPAWRAVEELA